MSEDSTKSPLATVAITLGSLRKAVAIVKRSPGAGGEMDVFVHNGEGDCRRVVIHRESQLIEVRERGELPAMDATVRVPFHLLKSINAKCGADGIEATFCVVDGRCVMSWNRDGVPLQKSEQEAFPLSPPPEVPRAADQQFVVSDSAWLAIATARDVDTKIGAGTWSDAIVLHSDGAIERLSSSVGVSLPGGPQGFEGVVGFGADDCYGDRDLLPEAGDAITLGIADDWVWFSTKRWAIARKRMVAHFGRSRLRDFIPNEPLHGVFTLTGPQADATLKLLASTPDITGEEVALQRIAGVSSLAFVTSSGKPTWVEFPVVDGDLPELAKDPGGDYRVFCFAGNLATSLRAGFRRIDVYESRLCGTQGESLLIAGFIREKQSEIAKAMEQETPTRIGIESLCKATTARRSSKAAAKSVTRFVVVDHEGQIVGTHETQDGATANGLGEGWWVGKAVVTPLK